MPEAEASGEEPRSRSARSVPEEPRKTIAELSAEILRDFPITGNEGATLADGYPSKNSTLFVNKGHGFKELDQIRTESSENSESHILHIDSSRESLDIIQLGSLDYSISPDDKFILVNRGNAELDRRNECIFWNMRGRKEVIPIDSSDTDAKAIVHSESVTISDNSFLDNRNSFEVYKGHGLLPGDEIGSGDTITDIIANDMYDEIVFDNTVYFGASYDFILRYRTGDGSLSPDLLAKRNAYISKMQAS